MYTDGLKNGWLQHETINEVDLKNAKPNHVGKAEPEQSQVYDLKHTGLQCVQVVTT